MTSAVFSLFPLPLFFFLHCLLLLTGSGLAQQPSREDDSQFPVFLLQLNDETMTLPVLPGFGLQVDLGKRDVRVAYTQVNTAVECLIWSDELFKWAKFGSVEKTPLETPFYQADRLYCWDSDQIDGAVMAEDGDGNQELIELKKQNAHLMTADWKRPLEIYRAVSFAYHQDDCRFWSRKDVSQSFSDRGSRIPWFKPFQGAVAVFCFRY